MRICWPPENEQRASRLQQLVDSMADLQTDVKDVATKMDKKNVQYRPAIDKLLKANGMDSVDHVINKAAAEMTPDERKAFEAVCYQSLLGHTSAASSWSLFRSSSRRSRVARRSV